MADTMVTFASQALATEFLTEEDIKKTCPAAFLTEGTNNVSDKYIVARTIDVVRDLERLGWKPVAAKQRKPQKGSSGRFNFHMIFFQNESISIKKTVTNPDGSTNEDVVCYPRIMLSNSMDGTCCFKFGVGLYRLVCSNGLVIASDTFADMKIRHIHYSFEDLKKLIEKVVEELPGQISVMNRMQERNLTEEEKKKLALEMFKLRVKKEDVELDEETYADLLSTIRPEDVGDDLWTVFNVLQEKMVKGLFEYTKEGSNKPRKARAIKGFVADYEFNKKAWELAESFLAN